MAAELIDDDFNAKELNTYYHALNWWERRRLLFNLCVFGVQALTVLGLWDATQRYGFISVLVQSVFYLIAANLFYCLGWGIEFLYRYYVAEKGMGHYAWQIMYWLGILFSVLLTFFAYSVSLIVL